MKKFRSIAVLIATVMIVVSCSTDRTQDVQIKKAADIHLKAVAKHDSILAILEKQKKQVERNLETETIPSNIQSYKAMLKSLDKSMQLLHDWDSELIGVPGVEHNHDHDHGHDHDHSHQDDILDDLSDREILEIQQAYSEHLDKIEDKISEVITTIELYSQNAEETTEK
jgi:ABC-type nickel/cobalt efflux system permease component RcnA